MLQSFLQLLLGKEKVALMPPIVSQRELCVPSLSHTGFSVPLGQLVHRLCHAESEKGAER